MKHWGGAHSKCPPFGSQHCSWFPLSHRWASRWSPCSCSHAHRGGGILVITLGTFSLWCQACWWARSAVSTTFCSGWRLQASPEPVPLLPAVPGILGAMALAVLTSSPSPRFQRAISLTQCLGIFLLFTSRLSELAWGDHHVSFVGHCMFSRWQHNCP